MCNVALPSEEIDDPSDVCNVLLQGVFWVSSIMLYTHEWANERAAPESIRALNLFPTCTVTVGQSDTSPGVMGVWRLSSPFIFITSGRGL